MVNYLHYEVLKPPAEFGLAPNRVGKQIKNLKLFIRNSVRRKICPPTDLERFKVLQIKTDNIYLTEDNLDFIEAIDLSDNPKRNSVRDLLLVGCETGLPYSDLINLKKECINEDAIRLTTRKTLRKVVIPKSPRLLRALQKNKGNFPPVTHKNDFNKIIKSIRRHAGISQSIQHIRSTRQQKN